MSNRGSEYRITQPRGGIKYPESTEGVEHMPRVVRKGPGEQRRICKVLGVNGSVCLPELPTGKANDA